MWARNASFAGYGLDQRYLRRDKVHCFVLGPFVSCCLCFVYECECEGDSGLDRLWKFSDRVYWNGSGVPLFGIYALCVGGDLYMYVELKGLERLGLAWRCQSSFYLFEEEKGAEKDFMHHLSPLYYFILNFGEYVAS